jgi:hypothetical protein
VLTRALALGEDDAGRAVASLDAIDTLLHRGDGDVTAAAASGDVPTAQTPAEPTLLARYLAQRAIAMDSLPRLQRLGEPAHAAMHSAHGPQPTSLWQSLWSRTLARVFTRQPR